MTPAKNDPAFGPGTDLGGALWGHDATPKGAEAHGLDPNCFSDCTEPSTIADGFIFGVAPDRKVVASSAVAVSTFTVPPILPPPEEYFSTPLCGPYCPEPLLGGAATAEPFVTVDPSLRATLLYPGHGGRDATARFSAALRAALVSPDVLFIPASEPSTLRSDETITRIIGGQPAPAPQAPSSPRALTILPEGAGFALHAIVALPDGTMDLAKVETFGEDVLPEISRFLGDPQKRAEMAVVYSRTADALFIVHSADTAQPPLPPRVLRRSSPSPIAPPVPWSRRSLAMSGRFRPLTRAVFSPWDWRIWVVERSSAPKAGWRLRRIDPLSGVEETSKLLPALHPFEQLWLTTWDDGRVLLVANRKGNAIRGAAKGGKGSKGDNDNDGDDKGKGKGNGKDGGNKGNDDNEDEGKNDNDGAEGQDGGFVVALLASEPFQVDGPLTVQGAFFGAGRVYGLDPSGGLPQMSFSAVVDYLEYETTAPALLWAFSVQPPYSWSWHPWGPSNQLQPGYSIPGGQLANLQAIGPNVFFSDYRGNAGSDIMVFDPVGGNRKLVTFPSKAAGSACCLLTDGKDMVWLQGSQLVSGETYASVNLMGAPFATSGMDLKPHVLRPAFQQDAYLGGGVIGGGYALQVEARNGNDSRIILTRLSDGYYWVIPPRGPKLSWGEQLYVDSEEFALVENRDPPPYIAGHWTIVRRTIASLGAPRAPGSGFD